MAIDFDTMMNDVIYDTQRLGVPAVLDFGSDGSVDVTVIDKSEGVMLEGQGGQSLFAAAKPAACIRVSELDANSIARESLKGATLAFKGKTWRIQSTEPKPSGAKGELYLILRTP